MNGDSLPLMYVTDREDRFAAMQDLLAGTAWELSRCQCPQEAIRAFRRAQNPIVLWDLDVDARSWQETLRDLRAARTDACVIVVADGSDPLPGVFDILQFPFSRDEILRALLFAYSYCRGNWPGNSPRRAFHRVVCGRVTLK